MRNILKVGIALVGVVYLIGFTVTGAALALSDRYECYETEGIIGIFWCPKEAIKARFGGYFVNSLLWPKYLLPEQTGKQSRLDEPKKQTEEFTAAEFAKVCQNGGQDEQDCINMFGGVMIGFSIGLKLGGDEGKIEVLVNAENLHEGFNLELRCGF